MEIDDNIFQAIQACWTGKASPEQIELIQTCRGIPFRQKFIGHKR